MAFATFRNVKITGISVVVPEKEISIFDELEFYDNNLKKVQRMNKIVGFNKRRVTEEGITPTDYAAQAAEDLISKLNIDRSTIDALINVEQKLTYAGPVDAYELHNRLGLSDSCICTNVAQGCAGWVWGLYLCSQMIQSGTLKKILLLNGDTPSLGIDIKDRNSAPIFGDAGSATLLEFCEEDHLSYYGIKTISSGYDSIIVPAGCQRIRYDAFKTPDDPFNAPLLEKFQSKSGYSTCILRNHLDGPAVFEFTMKEVPKHIKEVLKYSNKKVEDISFCCLHQANKQIIQTIAESAGFSIDKTPYSAFEKYGNNTMCSIPSVLSDLFIQNSKFDDKPYLVSGYGNGLVVATAVLDLSQTVSTGITIFKKNKGFKTRNEWIHHWKNVMQGK